MESQRITRVFRIHSLDATDTKFHADPLNYYFSYFLTIADPECQSGGGGPGVDKADLTLLQILQREQVNSPGR